MTPEQAYERGQRDMRNRIEKLFERYGISSLSWDSGNPLLMKRAKVGVRIRRECRIQPLEHS
jgi:hypothetical protein